VPPIRHLALYVDCDKATIGKGVALLRTLGNVVIASIDPGQAIQVLAKEPVTLVVVCDSVQGSERIDLVRRMRFIKGDVPIVLYSHSGIAREYLNTNVSDEESTSLEAILRRLIAPHLLPPESA
jgi:two-component SAPR family response regulator